MGIKVITKPSIYVLGRQAIDGGELGRFLADEGVGDWSTDAPSAAEGLVEVAGRTCYLSFASPRPGGNAAYIGHVLDVGHGSVTEHAVWNVLVTGVSRSLTHELVRHRVGLSPSQLSQRFVDESDCSFVIPPAIMGQDLLSREWRSACEQAARAYGELAQGLTAELTVEAWKASGAGWFPDMDPDCGEVDHAARWASKCLDRDRRTLLRKRAREAARSVLPNATETKIFLTGNARAWRHLFAMRGDVAADLEFRRLAAALATRLKAEAPNLFSDVAVGVGEDGYPSVTVRYPKV